MRVETAIKMIEDHGHKAFVCADGLCAISEVVQRVELVGDDCVFEEVTTFEIGLDAQAHAYTQWADGRYVDGAAIKAWLGY